MFKNFAGPGRDRVVIANFLRWASDHFPDRQRGVNFENKYLDIAHGENGAIKLACERGPKDPMRNCYTSIPAMIEFRLPDSSIRRMKLFPGATFADQVSALKMLLSYMALLADSGRLPEVMIFSPAPEGMVRACYYAT